MRPWHSLEASRAAQTDRRMIVEVVVVTGVVLAPETVVGVEIAAESARQVMASHKSVPD